MRNSTSETGNADQGHWVFGYGSLIYKVDFPYRQRKLASIEGWQRRFWQGSHDHRGTPEAPGRVLTLIPTPGTQCRGMAYEVDASAFEHLDHREKSGYQRHRIAITLLECGTQVPGTLYVAAEDNPAFLGPADMAAMAEQILRARGPSGSNRDYLLKLDQALREIGETDAHIVELARHVLDASPSRHSRASGNPSTNLP